MNTEELVNEQEKIVTFCKDNTIFPFYGKMQHDKFCCNLEPVRASSDNLENYLEAILHFEPTTVFVETEINDWIPNEEQTKKYLAYCEANDSQEEIVSFNKYVKRISLYEGQVYSFRITFLHENFNYEYYKQTNWSINVDMLAEARQEIENMDEDNDD